MSGMYDSMIYDIIVIGGGPAGVVSAIAAARGGASVLLVERHGFLGGMLTAAGTGPMMSFHAGKTQVVRGIPDEIVQRLVKMNMSPGHLEDFVGYCATITPFNSEALKKVMEDMCMEAGVTLLYHTSFIDCEKEDGCITKVRLFAKNGFFEAKAKVFIDASADADLSVSAGVGTTYGRESDHTAQAMTLNMLIGGVDREKVLDYVLDNQDDMLPTIPFDHLREIPRAGIQGGKRLLDKARESGKLTINNDHMLVFETNTKGQVIVNMTHMYDLCSVDAADLTKAEIEGRRQAWELFVFLKEDVPGFENAHLIQTGPNIGVRESRKINGVYKLDDTDITENVMFPDAVAMGGYPIDVHLPGEGSHRKVREGTWYSIPYRCLITNELKNLIVAGRCISTTHRACGATRVTPILMAIAQGAGTAAAIAVKTGCDVKNVDTDVLRNRLKEDGAFLEEYHDPGTV